jgi:hypothetical protein
MDFLTLRRTGGWVKVIRDTVSVQAVSPEWGGVVSLPSKLAAGICLCLATGLMPGPAAAGWIFGDDPLGLSAERDLWRDQAARCWRVYGLLLGHVVAPGPGGPDRTAFMAHVKKRVKALDQREAALNLWQRKLGEIARRLEKTAAGRPPGPARPGVATPGRPAPPPARSTAPIWTALGGRPCDVIFVLDASGSMRRLMRFPRLRRFDLARYKIIELARDLPAGSRVALRVFGSRTGNRQADRPRGCRDSILLRGLGPNRPAALIDLLRRIRPSGWTCIGWSLRLAVDSDLKSSRRKCRAIVVISDGDDQCEFMHGRVKDIEARVRSRGVRVFQVHIGPTPPAAR